MLKIELGSLLVRESRESSDIMENHYYDSSMPSSDIKNKNIEDTSFVSEVMTENMYYE